MSNDELIKKNEEIQGKLDNTRYLLYKLQMKIYNLIEDKSCIDMKKLFMDIVSIYEETL